MRIKQNTLAKVAFSLALRPTMVALWNKWNINAKLGGEEVFSTLFFEYESKNEEIFDFSLLSHERNRSEGNLSFRADWRSRLWRWRKGEGRREGVEERKRREAAERLGGWGGRNNIKMFGGTPKSLPTLKRLLNQNTNRCMHGGIPSRVKFYSKSFYRKTYFPGKNVNLAYLVPALSL